MIKLYDILRKRKGATYPAIALLLLVLGVAAALELAQQNPVGAPKTVQQNPTSAPGKVQQNQASVPGKTQHNPTAAPVKGKPRTVTLITGDKVILASSDDRFLSFEPGLGREGMTFTAEYQSSHRRGDEHLFVTPMDAAPLIAAGKLDRALFDITALVEYGYDDDNRDNLPLIIMHAERSAHRSAASNLSLVGASVKRRLDSVQGVGVEAGKREIRQLWDSLAWRANAGQSKAAPTLPTLGASVEKVWLDRLHKPLLDRSAAQIGAPDAWASGYTGRSVVVAVIDTGVDLTHPDLAGKIIDSRNFTEDVDDDTVGHGTHVAATIAGSGAASDGRYRGIAPDANLVSGKVCTIDSCMMSAIIEAMEWAVVEKRARVINMSLGGEDTPGLDPEEEAVNRLTSEYGALFVIAAGNSGDGRGTISSPASADAALAVGAVDRIDQIAPFSSRGPRTGDDAIKPEITAPGVGIVAARAHNTQLGEPVGARHVAASGTSMAAPHVAGAAALLIERHPDWAPQQLKSGLMGSARFNPALRVFDQGAGRLDVMNALHTTIIASTPALNLGTASWPHDDDQDIVRRIEYRNHGKNTATFSVLLDVRGPDGTAGPSDMFTVKPERLTLPAGGSASVTLTVNTRLRAADGEYTGRVLVAAADGSTASTLLSLEREEESYDLVLRHLDRSGSPTSSYSTTIVPLHKELPQVPRVGGIAGDVTVRLPRGRYGVQYASFAPPPKSEFIQLIMPTLDVEGDGHLTLDARMAQPVLLKPPSTTVEQVLMHLGWKFKAAWGDVEGFSFGPGSQQVAYYTGHLGQPARGFTSFISAQWLTPSTPGKSHGRSELYAASWPQRHVFFNGLKRAVSRKHMATVEAAYLPSLPGVSEATLAAAADQGNAFRIGPFRHVTLPHRRQEFYTTAESGGWVNRMMGGPNQYEARRVLTTASKRYAPHSRYRSLWNDPPFAPIFINNDAKGAVTPHRTGDHLVIDGVGLFGDRTHWGDTFTDSQRLTLYYNGKKAAEIEGRLRAEFVVPAQSAAYRLEMLATQDLHSLSEGVGVIWEFRSSHVSGTSVRLPLMTAQFAPPLNWRGEAVAGSHVWMPLSIWRNGDVKPVLARDVEVEVSFDDGSTWIRSPLKMKGTDVYALIKHPSRSGYVSLRARARDDEGNSVEQTLVRAYALRARSASGR